MIQDVIDLRARKWVSRRQQDQAKKISEIHKEQEEQERANEQARLLASVSLGPIGGPMIPTAKTGPRLGRVADRYSMPAVGAPKLPPVATPPTNANGWQTVSTSANRPNTANRKPLTSSPRGNASSNVASNSIPSPKKDTSDPTATSGKNVFDVLNSVDVTDENRKD
jgi:translation initiation factor 4G